MLDGKPIMITQLLSKRAKDRLNVGQYCILVRKGATPRSINKLHKLYPTAPLENFCLIDTKHHDFFGWMVEGFDFQFVYA